ncbi:MAG: ATP-dependent Clp protease ATP-binding subunit [Oligoflexales bacterium]|nr:ATP-dependent Clp protease ATP-binding subunit [Oligoflexales bacterium]
MPQKFLRNSTVKVADLLQKAITELASLRRGMVTVEFLLMALLDQKDSIFFKVAIELGLDPSVLRRHITDKVLEHGQTLPVFQPGEVQASMKISRELQLLFEAAERERKLLEDTYISTHAVFLSFFDKGIKGVKSILEQEGLAYEKVLGAIRALRGNSRILEKEGESRTKALEEYTIDVTAQARRGELDPVIGREEEITRVVEILSRRKKNNPILIGEPGVGKTVIVEGLAQKIVNADVPDYLLNRRVLSLELATLIAGAKMQGEFEERLKAIKDEVLASSGDIILFIDEIHTVVGTGRSGGGGLDASNMLKPALARGLLQCIGATTLKEYRQYIETDKALERRFQTVKVEEPSLDQAVQMLKDLKHRYEKHHHVEYTDESIEKAVLLSHRYIQNRFLPDKAIDLIDEAGASKRMKIIYMPPDIRKMENKKQDFENQKLKAFEAGDFEVMANLQMKIAALDLDLGKLRKEKKEKIVEEDKKITGEDIAALIGKKVGIPVDKVVSEEADKLKNLETIIKKRVVGQDHAISSIANAIRRNRSGLRKVDSPIASFLFLGPTGVGKTELAKALAEQVLDDESKIIRLDMSEYMERHSVSKLIGSPPGYVGFGEGGQLTEKVKHSPYSVILLDEFEKAHPDVYNILLPVLDEGWLTDAEGQKVSFRNCIIIGTSNIGAHILVDKKRPVGLVANDDLEEEGEERAEMMKELKKFLRPEFINRLDEVVIFNRLSKEELSKILDIQKKDLEERLKNLGLDLVWDEGVSSFVLAQIDTFQYGARPLKRKLELLIENKIANFLIEKGKSARGQILIHIKEKEIQVELVS